jgi:hypothetical protein
VISAERFARERPSYWNQLLPRLEPFVRLLNLSAGRFSPPMFPGVDPNRRAFVAELGFELFRGAPHRPIDADDASVEAAAVLVRARIARLSTLDEDEILPPSPLERIEAIALARRLRRFVHQRGALSFTVDPDIPGCGIIDGATADLLITRASWGIDAEPDRGEHLLYEVKTVARPFRAGDIRQLVTYAALMAADSQAPVTVGVVNPRLGTFVECPLDRLAVDISGLGANSLLQQIIFDVSAAEVSL